MLVLNGTILTAKDLNPECVIVPTLAVAVAPDPLLSVIVTVGVDVYSLPGFVIVNPVIAPPETVAVAVAPIPPPPEIVTTGFEL